MDAQRVEAGYRQRRLPLALVLLVGFVGLVTVAVASVLWLSIRSAHRSVGTLVGERTELTIENVIGHMRLHLDQPREQAEFLAMLIGRDTDAAIAPRLQDLMLGSMAGVPQVEGLAFLDSGGHALWIERESAAKEVTISRRVQAPEVKAAFDDARQRTGAYWGPIIWSARLQRPLLNLRTPIRRGEETVGVLLSFVALDELSDMLSAGRYGRGENTFILLGRDAVLAHPNLTRGLPPLSPSHPVPSLDEVGDPILSGMWTGRVSAPPDSEYFGSGLGHIAKIGGEEYVFLYRELAEYGDTPWLFGRYFRLSDVDAEVRRIAATASWGLLILFVAAVCALLLGRALAGPIRSLAETAHRVRDLDIQDLPPLPRSSIRELDSAATAFNAMIFALRWFERYVPKSLVRALIAAGDEAAPLAEERVVTVLFTDIRGFSGLAQTLSPTETAELLNDHFKMLVAFVEAEGGIVDKYIGDSMMAFWGAPVPYEDHALRACRAALAIADAIKRDNASRQERALTPLRVRLGLHTGPAVVGNIGAPGRLNYTLVGDTVNVAHRIEQLCDELALPEDDVTALVSASTAQRLDSSILADRVGLFPLRGRLGSMGLYMLKLRHADAA